MLSLVFKQLNKCTSWSGGNSYQNECNTNVVIIIWCNLSFFFTACASIMCDIQQTAFAMDHLSVMQCTCTIELYFAANNILFITVVFTLGYEEWHIAFIKAFRGWFFQNDTELNCLFVTKQ